MNVDTGGEEERAESVRCQRCDNGACFQSREVVCVSLSFHVYCHLCMHMCTASHTNRDLAEQTHKCFQQYGKHLTAPGLSSVLLVGGLDAGAQLKALKEGG